MGVRIKGETNVCKKGDKVRVIAGKDKGNRSCCPYCPSKVNKVIVEGVNIVKKHQRPNNETSSRWYHRKRSTYPRIKRSSFGQKWCSWSCWLQICRRQKVRYNKNQAKCLINHEGKEKYNGKSFKRKIS